MTPTIAIVATITTTPPYRDTVETALRNAAEATRTESGCEQYALHGSPSDDCTFVMIERWRDQDSLDNHAAGEAFAALSAAMDGKATLRIERYLPLI